MAAPMQFWGVEVKAKEPCQVALGGGSLIHVSQVTLGGIKKDDESVIVHVKVGEQKLVMAILNKNTPQMSFDLVFDEDFEISHNWKNGSIHLLGYQNEETEEIESDFDDSSDEEMEDDVPIAIENGSIAPAVKPKAADKSKPEVTVKANAADKSKPEVKDQADSDDDSESDEDFDEDTDDVVSDEDGTSVSEDDEDGSDDGSDDLDGSDEETPAKEADAGKKRPNADAKTPPQSKKAKIATPQKTDGKKGVAPTTPLSSKKGAKTPGGDKTPKSGGSEVPCGSCKKTFKTGTALEAHSKAKHGAQ